MNLPAWHSHITEREVWHRWPDGQIDDAHWEDCAFTSAVEWARLTAKESIPATHVEAEALRKDAGLTPAGGAYQWQVVKGLYTRYGAHPAITYGATAIWNAMSAGTAASVQGSYGVWPDGSKWRRWDPAFKGIHQATAIRLDSQDHVWWCDPLAPQDGTYKGEWMPKAEFLKYINGFAGGGALVGSILVESPDTSIGEDMDLAPYVVKAFDPNARMNFNKGVHTAYTPKGTAKMQTLGADSGAHVSCTVAIPKGIVAIHGGFAYITDGIWAGMYMPLWEGTLQEPDAPAVDCSAEVAAAVAPLNSKIKWLRGQRDKALARIKTIKDKVAGLTSDLDGVAADIADD